MERRLPRTASDLLTGLALAGLTAAAWAAWLGWDQHRDVRGDGTTTGPYEAWQVIGLVLTLLPPVYWAASRRHALAAVLGVPLGLTACAFLDWSDDASGLFMVGVTMVLVGSLAVTAAVTALITYGKRAGRPRGTAGGTPAGGR
ncbi:hypothetical protein [Streptomyces chromofuscus]|uniref:Uncharacterized protein n=1 Tax=Streptomyces chromofuscus TaxID=42881 RepID=A0A7M2T042_STRCW|nr:hypothetical protein [Streptomyces chromofuscus]QOV42017.1 hypothetical protein IPT68_19265 [Streptomyces chromofuscus]